MCVWACKLRTALEATWLRELCVCVFVVAALCLPTHTSSNKKHLNRMGWKNPFYRQKAKAYVHTRSGGWGGIHRKTMSRSQTGKPGHTQRKGNLPLPTSYHSTTNLHNYQNRAGEKRVGVKSLLTGWWGGAVPTDGETRQGWRRQAPQHVGEEVGVGGHGEAVEVGARHWVALPSHGGSSPPPVTDQTWVKTPP